MKCTRGVLYSAFVGLILFAGVARASSINNLVLSVNSLSSCPTGSFCFGWAPDATSISFSLPNSGIIPGQYFLLNFGCASGTCSWPGGTSVTAVWNTNVPEPSSMALVLTGFGAIIARRRPWKTREKEQPETCTS